jgi:hypothetical protein
VGLNAAEIVDYLDDEQQLGAPEASPWPEYESGQGDLYLIDWRSLFGSQRNEPIFQGIDDPELADAVGSALGRGAPDDGTPEADEMAARRPEVCAWYQPIHFHGMGWGIFIREDCVRSIAVDIARFVHPAGGRGGYGGGAWSYLPELLRMAFASLFLHEAYHHKTEALAIRLHVAERTPCYRSYWRKVYEPLTHPGAVGPLEEALANADSYQRLAEPAYRRFVSDEVYQCARRYLKWRFPLDPPGYKDAIKYLTKPKFDDAQNKLRSQVQEAKAKPFRPAAQWRLAPNMNESLFGLSSDIWLVVPSGRGPSVPTFPLYRPVATRSIESALASEYGYSRTKGGKGSHIKLKAADLPTLVLPGGRKDLSPPVLKSIATALGFSDIGDLLTELGL